MRTPMVYHNGTQTLADARIDGVWYLDGKPCRKVQGAYGQNIYIREDFADDVLSRKATNDNTVGDPDRYGVSMKIHYHLPLTAMVGRVYALCETVNGGILRCASNKPNTVILRFPTYNNLSALSKILMSFDKVDAIGETIYVTFKRDGQSKKTLEIPYTSANELIKTLQEERLEYLKG